MSIPAAKRLTKMIRYAFAGAIQGARMLSWRETRKGKETSLVFDFLLLDQRESEVFERDGTLYERVCGMYFPARIRFSGVTIIKPSKVLASLDQIPRDDETRLARDLLSWQMKEDGGKYHILSMNARQGGSLHFLAENASWRRLAGEPNPVEYERPWGVAPPMPARTVLEPQDLYSRFGGDPIPVRVDGRKLWRSLFVGGLEAQGRERPTGIDFVLNLGEEPSQWARGSTPHPQDRWDNKAEGSEGMSAAELRAEAEWVIERLRPGKRVLVHCLAGMNRSASVCCAVLILLEGLTAEQALERVRKTHLWARPDGKQWLALKWLAKSVVNPG
jgi:hypothetical protein